MASTGFQYTPLSSESAFRLLRLKQPAHPETSTDILEIELFEASLVNPPAYEAVSYAWDHAGPHASLICNGRQLRASPLVVDMINALSRISAIGVFWIDALCIDQSSVLDKNNQVPRMRDIYSEACSVWIWLGRGSNETKLAFEFLIEMDGLCGHDLATSNTRLARKWRARLREYQGTVKRQRGVYDAVDTDFIVDIINLPWFHRTWTVQEVALAKAATLVCGTITLSWRFFLEILKQLQHSLNEYTMVLGDSNEKTLSNPAAFFDDVRTQSMMTDIVLHRRSSPISRAFDLIRQNYSTDPKDKVYGLYGIFDHLQIRTLPPVDYKRSVQQVYCDTTRAIFQHDRSLHLLYLIGLRPHMSGLPTWVPDYSNTDFIRFIDVYGNKASAKSPPIFSFGTEGTEDDSLSLHGVVLDEIHEQASSTSVCTANFRRGFAARSSLSSVDERFAAVTELIRTLQSWIKVSRTINHYPTGETTRTAFYETMTQPLRPGSQNWTMPIVSKAARDVFEKWSSIVTADTSQDAAHFHIDIAEIESDPGSAAIVDDYIRLFGCSPDPKEWSAELQIRLVLRARDQILSNLQHDISLLSYHRTFFTTKNGYMGVGPRRARPMDSVALISGLQLPFIIRKAGDKYILIGPAYIHGIMKGERWDSGLAEEIILV